MAEAPTNPSELPTADNAAQATAAASKQSDSPIWLMVDPEQSIRRFMPLILHGFDIDTTEFANTNTLLRTPLARAPDLVPHAVALDFVDSVALIVALAKRSYSGPMHSMSSRGGPVLDHVKSVGLRHKLQLKPA